MSEPTFEADVTAPSEGPTRFAPPPRRPHRALRVMIPVIVTFFLASVVASGTRDFSAWWAILLGAASSAAIASAHPSQRVRLLTYWLGVLPLLALHMHIELAFSTLAAPMTVDRAEPSFAAVLACVWPSLVGPVAVLFGALFDGLRTHLGLASRAHPMIAGCVALVASIVGGASLVGFREPDPGALTDDVVVIESGLRANDAGLLHVASMTLFHRDDDGVGRWDLSPLLTRHDGIALGETIELVEAEGRRFVRAPGSNDLARWALVDRIAGELRVVEPRDVPLPIEAPRSATLALAVSLLVSLALLVRRARLARLRRRIAVADEGRVDDEGIATVGAHRVVLAPAPPPGPVVLFGRASSDGAYRLSPSIEVAGFLPGTRYGRRLRLLAAMDETWAWIAWWLLLGVLPALVALAHGRLLPGLG